MKVMQPWCVKLSLSKAQLSVFKTPVKWKAYSLILISSEST